MICKKLEIEIERIGIQNTEMNDVAKISLSALKENFVVCLI